ncbi:camp-regulated phosphoprotein/endosulfine conserved region-domain-containing protein [Hypoxylon sp. FL1284]|nr:camp-regulated phosphoprotein/endosulfine conserved region-domain-containing protein [Hypoxylon sp. FL1284]
MNPHQKNKVDVKSLSPEEQRLFRLYGKLPSRSDHFAKHLKERKYFDSGDYAMSKAGKGDAAPPVVAPRSPRLVAPSKKAASCTARPTPTKKPPPLPPTRRARLTPRLPSPKRTLERVDNLDLWLAADEATQKTRDIIRRKRSMAGPALSSIPSIAVLFPEFSSQICGGF